MESDFADAMMVLQQGAPINMDDMLQYANKLIIEDSQRLAKQT